MATFQKMDPTVLSNILQTSTKKRPANDTDLDGETLTITSVQSAVNGTVIVNGDGDFVFSMASYKRRALNYHLLERFIDKLNLDPTLIKSHPNYSNLYDYGAIAA